MVPLECRKTQLETTSFRLTPRKAGGSGARARDEHEIFHSRRGVDGFGPSGEVERVAEAGREGAVEQVPKGATSTMIADSSVPRVSERRWREMKRLALTCADA